MYPGIAVVVLKGARDVKSEGAIGSVGIFFFFIQTLQIVGHELSYLNGLPYAKELVSLFIELSKLEYDDTKNDPCTIPACPPYLATFTMQWRFVAIGLLQPLAITTLVWAHPLPFSASGVRS